MDKAKVLEALNLDLEHEMSAMLRYLHHSFLVTGPLRGSLVELFRTKATESMAHAVKLGEKITALGGHPSVKIQEIYEAKRDHSITDMLEENLKAERFHLGLYEKQLELVEGNTPLRLMIEQFLIEEVKHIEELEMYVREDAKKDVRATVLKA